jgi:hypothetical protein
MGSDAAFGKNLVGLPTRYKPTATPTIKITVMII